MVREAKEIIFAVESQLASDDMCGLGDSTCGQRAVYEIGLTGIPIYNVRARRMVLLCESHSVLIDVNQAESMWRWTR